MTRNELIAFETEVKLLFEAAKIRGPVHLSGGNEEQLISIFKEIERQDWIFSAYRSHYHALLHGIPADLIMQQIMASHSMNLAFPDYRFFTSAIVGGPLPIAVGVAAGIKRSGSKQLVWCFTGDMAARSGAFHEAHQYAQGHDLPIRFVVEDNGLSCDSPTDKCWGEWGPAKSTRYQYVRVYPHVGVGAYVNF